MKKNLTLFLLFISITSCFAKTSMVSAQYKLIVDNEIPLSFNYQPKQPNKPISYTETISVKTQNGESFNAYYINNNSDKLIVFGHGFRSSHKDMEKHAALFIDQGVDLVLFDYRSTNRLIAHTFNKKNIKSPYDTLITQQKSEIFALVKHMKAKKNYQQIIGLGECYSAYLFTLSQADAVLNKEPLFDSLILDSCFYSISMLIRQILADPFLCRDSKTGGFPKVIRTLFLHDGGIAIIGKMFDICGKEYPLKPSLEILDQTPVLFIHGIKDKLVQKAEFNQLWEYKAGPKMLFQTPFAHGQNKEAGDLYATVCMQFIESQKKPFLTINDFKTLPLTPAAKHSQPLLLSA